MEELTVSLVRSYLAEMQRTWRPGTTSAVRDQICSWLGWLADEGYIGHENWPKRIPKVTVDRGAPKRLSVEQVAALLTAVEVFANRRDTAIIYLLLDTGLRSGELRRLLVTDVDLENRSVRVSSSCKSRKERYVWFCPETARRIKAYLRSRRTDSPWLFVTRAKQPLGASLLLHMIKHIGRDAGIPDLTVHRFRHTALTMLAEAGMSPILLQKFAGHASVATTLIYARPDDKAVQEEYERVLPRLKAAL